MPRPLRLRTTGQQAPGVTVTHATRTTVRPLGLALLTSFGLGLAAGTCGAQSTSSSATANAGAVSIEGAIHRVLTENPQVAVQRSRVAGAAGVVRTTQGAFDWALQAELSSAGERAAVFDSTTGVERQSSTRVDGLTIEASRFLRNGWTLSLRNATTRTRLRNAATGAVGATEVIAGLTVPLLKGAGSESALADTEEARMQLAATTLDSRFSIIDLVRAGIVAYWNSYALQQNIAILDETMRRAGEITDVLQAKLDGGEIAPIEYQRSLANLKLREIDLLEASADATRAREQLAVLIGVDRNGRAPQVSTPLPEPLPLTAIDALEVRPLVTLAIDNRLDLEALQARHQARLIALDESERDLKPQLDLELSLGYSAARPGFSPGDSGTLFLSERERDGPDYSVGLVFSYAFGNNAAEGVVDSTRATVIEARGAIDSLLNTIRSDVALAVNDLRISLQSLERAERSRTLLDTVAVETRRKLTLGEATFTDLISVEDDLAESRLQVTNALRDYATALVALRFATGTLAEADDGGVRVEGFALRELPRLAQ